MGDASSSLLWGRGEILNIIMVAILCGVGRRCSRRHRRSERRRRHVVCGFDFRWRRRTRLVCPLLDDVSTTCIDVFSEPFAAKEFWLDTYQDATVDVDVALPCIPFNSPSSSS
jgi:hypothetical protein